MKFSRLETGMTMTVQKTVTREDTALNFGSGALKNLLATPTLAALMIEASVKLIDPLLPEGYISVGKAIEIEHEHPTIQGMTVTVTAKLMEISGNSLTLEIIANDDLGRIGSGYHERQIVKHSILMSKVEERVGMLQSKP